MSNLAAAMFSAMTAINGDSKRAEMKRFMALEILRLESTVRQLANWINLPRR